MARLATRLLLGETIESLGLKDKVIPYHGAKEGRTLSRAYRVYFVNSQIYTASFAMQNQGSNRQVATFPGVDPILGPEMRSTGEVLGLAETFPMAFYKSQEAAGSELPHAPAAWENKKNSDFFEQQEKPERPDFDDWKNSQRFGIYFCGHSGNCRLLQRKRI